MSVIPASANSMNFSNSSAIPPSSVVTSLAGTSSVQEVVSTSFKPVTSPLSISKQQLNLREGIIDSPLNNAVKASGYDSSGVASQLVSYNSTTRNLNTLNSATYDKEGRLNSAVAAPGSSSDAERDSVPIEGLEDRDGETGDESAEIKRRAETEVEKQQLLEEQKLIENLSSRDREVRAHEQAHAAVGGSYAGAPTYQFERGPDGVNYAVGGEVQIDTSRAATPQETITKAQIIRRAALAPAEPSPQDRSVAQEAVRMEAEARSELASERVKQTADVENKTEADNADEQISIPDAEISSSETSGNISAESEDTRSRANDTVISSRLALTYGLRETGVENGMNTLRVSA